MAALTFTGASLVRLLHARKDRVASGMPAVRGAVQPSQQRPRPQQHQKHQVAVEVGMDSRRIRSVCGTMISGASGMRGELLKPRVFVEAAVPSAYEEIGKKQVRARVHAKDPPPGTCKKKENVFCSLSKVDEHLKITCDFISPPPSSISMT